MIKEMACTSCPNGCKLHVDGRGEGSRVFGNFCQHGVAYAYKQLKDLFPAPFHSEREFLSVDDANRICASWGVTVKRIHPGIPILGSPERTLYRTVFSTSKNERFILEEVDKSKVMHKEQIALNVELFTDIIPVVSYVKGPGGKSVHEVDGRYWMIHPYVEHEHLNREEFWRDEWRGKEVAKILNKIQRAEYNSEIKVFSVESYVAKLVSVLKNKHPEIYQALGAILALLHDRLFPYINNMPKGFCHGDAHPFNMLWGKDRIIAVIDWEFSGVKPRIYDLALITGCVGTEDETALGTGFVQALINELRGFGLISNEEWDLFPYLVLALRFNWLAEWLRRKDEEMISFELFYMGHLIEYYNLNPLSK